MRAKFRADTSQGQALAGYMDGLAETVSTKRYVDDVIRYTEHILSEEFGIAMDQHAMRFPFKYRHVYEWGQTHDDLSTVGNPMKRLWALKSTGRGGRRTLGFTFLPSVVPSPIHPELIKVGVKEEVHIFVWKAPITEYNLPVVVRPQLSKVLVWYDDDNEKVIVRPTPVRTRPGSVNGAAGAFTTYFINWWTNGQASRQFNKRVRPVLEKDLTDTSPLRAVIGQYKRKKSVSVGIDNNMAFKAGKATARKKFSQASSEYIAEAAQRRFDLYGD